MSIASRATSVLKAKVIARPKRPETCCSLFLRSFSNGASRSVNIFDRNAKRIQRNRAASVENPELYDYLKDEVAGQIVDRVCDIARRGSCANMFP